MKWYLLAGLFFGAVALRGQSAETIIQQFLFQEQERLGLSTSDLTQWQISSHHTSSLSGVQHVYIYQTHQGIPLHDGVANFAIKDGRVRSMGNRLISQVAQLVNATSPGISPVEAIKQGAQAMGLPQPSGLRVVKALSSTHFEYSKGGISLENIPVQLCYAQNQEGKLRLAWDMSIYQLDAQHWWSMRVDALTGALLHHNDWVVHCQFDGKVAGQCVHTTASAPDAAPEQLNNPTQYNVFDLPVESPSHGSRSLVVNPEDSLASPFGWHDTDGVLGAEYTITRGNNVHAYEDTSNTNQAGYSPDGGSSFNFNFPYVQGAAPLDNLDAAITNLFYMNNKIHDVWYQYGFDEASGNFQHDNYGRGALGTDPVRAEAQDGSGTSNANFATPPDGLRPRMQMYIWPMNASTGHFLNVTAPANLASTYITAKAEFGPLLPAIPIVAPIVALEDAVAPTHDGCDSVINASLLQGKIVLVDAGVCAFADKVEAAQNAGAAAVLVTSGFPFVFVMGGSNPNITIPSLMIPSTLGANIHTELQAGVTVIGQIDNNGISDKDSDFDNGIIIHEYGHGISNRLTGGGNRTGCLHNDEQMGEGWSDWFGLMMTLEPGDQGGDRRGIGTHVIGEPTTGDGIRPAPYSTDFAINNYTYGATNDNSLTQPHGVGFVFATVLWDLNWALIDAYGGTPDPDLYHGTGGNNIAMRLVIEGLKLQPCGPGMIDGRDAILMADSLIYNGAHQCLIWEVFARRGFGYSASQGSPDSRSDQVEAFDLSPICLVAAAPPIAAFVPSAFNSCVATMSFQDSSYSTPHQWAWDFGDGGTSTQRNPTHTYRLDGVYNVRLIVTNNLGSDTMTQTITVTLPPVPTAPDVEVCAGDTATLVATGTGDIQWKNIRNQVIQQGDTLLVSNTGSVSTYYAENLTNAPLQTVGPVDTVGNGLFDTRSNFHGGLNFYADQALDLVTAEVYSSGTVSQTFFLSVGQNTTGAAPSPTDILGSTTVYLQPGWQKIQLRLSVPDTGWYCLGGSNLVLYYNTAGFSYPYTLPNLLTIASSTSGTGEYPYFYNLEVREKPCISPTVAVSAVPVSSAFSYTNMGTTFNFTDASIDATSWFWEFGDGATSTLRNPTHTYADNSMRTVRLTINGGSCTSEQVINNVIGVSQVNGSALRFYVQPNPAQDWIQLELNHPVDERLTVQLYDIQGRVLRTVNWAPNTTRLNLALEGLSDGVYVVRLQGSDFTEIRKIRVQP